MRRGYGWMADDNRPVLTLTQPRLGTNPPLEQIIIGAYDYYSGLDVGSLRVTADFEVDGMKPGTNLAEHFVNSGRHVWRLELKNPIQSPSGEKNGPSASSPVPEIGFDSNASIVRM